MSSAVSNVSQTQPVAPPTRTPPPPKPAKTESQPAQNTDTVTLSPAAQAKVAALQESRETPAQTSQEANGGDVAALRLQAKEAVSNSGSR